MGQRSIVDGVATGATSFVATLVTRSSASRALEEISATIRFLILLAVRSGSASSATMSP